MKIDIAEHLETEADRLLKPLAFDKNGKRVRPSADPPTPTPKNKA